MPLGKSEFQSLLIENTLDLLAALRDETRMTSAIAMLADNEQEGIVLASLAGNCDHCYAPRVGSHFQLHCTAPGKALLAFQTPEKCRRIALGLEYQRFTAKTCANAAEFLRMLEKQASLGYAFDEGEYVEGVNCVAACIHDPDGKPMAAIWITALSIELPTNQLEAFTRPVLKACREMEHRLLNAQEDSSLHTQKLVDEAKHYIDLNFANTELIQKYFDQLNLSSSWFRKLFKERHGLAPMQYRQHRLHERAKKLLDNTKLSVKEISFQLNYESQNYFSRAFKTREGVSPQAYRDKASR